MTISRFQFLTSRRVEVLNERTALYNYIRAVAGNLNIGYRGGPQAIMMLDNKNFPTDEDLVDLDDDEDFSNFDEEYQVRQRALAKKKTDTKGKGTAKPNDSDSDEEEEKPKKKTKSSKSRKQKSE